MNRLLAPLLAFTVVAGVVGCRTSAPPAGRPDNISAAAYPQVVAQGRLEGNLRHDRATVQRSDSGAMTVSVPVRHTRRREIAAQYRFIFLDSQNRPLRPEMDWQYILMPPRTQVFLEATSPQLEAVDWRLEVRQSR